MTIKKIFKVMVLSWGVFFAQYSIAAAQDAIP